MKLGGVPHDVINNLNSFAIMILILVMNLLVYSALRRVGTWFTPVKRITCGFFVGATAMLGACAVHDYIQKTSATPCITKEGLAEEIECKSPISVRVTKRLMRHGRLFGNIRLGDSFGICLQNSTEEHAEPCASLHPPASSCQPFRQPSVSHLQLSQLIRYSFGITGPLQSSATLVGVSSGSVTGRYRGMLNMVPTDQGHIGTRKQVEELEGQAGFSREKKTS